MWCWRPNQLLARASSWPVMLKCPRASSEAEPFSRHRLTSPIRMPPEPFRVSRNRFKNCRNSFIRKKLIMIGTKLFGIRSRSWLTRLSKKWDASLRHKSSSTSPWSNWLAPTRRQGALLRFYWAVITKTVRKSVWRQKPISKNLLNKKLICNFRKSSWRKNKL